MYFSLPAAVVQRREQLLRSGFCIEVILHPSIRCMASSSAQHASFFANSDKHF